MASEPGQASSSKRRVQRERDAYADVGAATRAAIERVIESGGCNALARVFLATLHLTTTFSRIADDVYVDQVAAIAHVDRRKARRQLAWLSGRGVIVWQPRSGRGRRSTLALQREWKTGPLMALISGEKRGPDANAKAGRFGTEKGAGGGPPTEKVSEKDDEEGVVVGPESLDRSAPQPHEDDERRRVLDALLRPLGEVWPDQWPLLADALAEDEAGFRGLCAAFVRAQNPIAALVAAVKRGDHVATSPAKVTAEERRERWVRTTGLLFELGELADHLADQGAEEAECARLLELARSIRGGAA